MAVAGGESVRDARVQSPDLPRIASAEIQASTDSSAPQTLSIHGPILGDYQTHRAEPDPGPVAQLVQSAAVAFGGVLLAGSGIAYWTHFSSANNYLDRHGVNSIAFPILATVAIPVGVLMTGFGGMDFIGNLVSGKSGD